MSMVLAFFIHFNVFAILSVLIFVLNNLTFVHLCIKKFGFHPQCEIKLTIIVIESNIVYIFLRAQKSHQT